MNAVKELIENSLDAGANRISVHVQVPAASSSTETSAGLFSIQVTDNGGGISKADLELLCERHATSKLTCVGDLRAVGTFGFRGEALASCSQVARVEVVTRSREDSEEVAWKATYLAGKLTGEPIPLAGNFGTIINVKDLFYGNRVRREALLNSSEEFQKIYQVIQAYALNQAGKCAFALSKRRDRMEVQTLLTDGVVAVVKNLWGEELGGALLPFEIKTDEKLGIEEGSGGWATRTTFHKLKSPQVIIFLNGRLIEHATLRRAVLQAFAMHLPTSPPAHPFIYLCLRVKGSRVDVNVHPSKKQVYFLDEGEIVGRVVEAIEEGVLRKQYETQNLKPIVIESGEMKRAKTVESTDSNRNNGVASKPPQKTTPTPSTNTPATIPKISNLYPSQRVLTDNKNHRIDTFLYHSSQSQTSKIDGGMVSGWSTLGRVRSSKDDVVKLNERVSPLISGIPMISGDSVSSPLMNKELPSSPLISEPIKNGSSQEMSIILDSQSSTTMDSALSIINDSSAITSSLLISASFNSQEHSQPELLGKANDQLCKLLRESLVVGLIDSKWCLLQSGTNLMLCDMDRLNFELFYSLVGQKCFDKERVFEIEEMRVRGVFDDEEIGREGEELLKGQVKFLSDEFGIKFEKDFDGLVLKEMPIVITGQRRPSKKHLSTFIQRLCLVPDYDNRNVAWRQVAEEMATVYGLVDGEEWNDWEEYVRHVVLPAYRDSRARYTLRDEFRYDGDQDNINDITVLPPLQIITNTETLYKSFERC